jgi:diguanylate cyclase (GGDEF)-like protein
MDQQFAKRSDMDFLHRSMPGVLLYALIWPLLAWTTDIYQFAPTFTLIFASVFTGISLLRFIHAFSTRFVYDDYPRIWRGLLFFLSFSHAISLSTLAVLMINQPVFHEWVIMALMIVLTLIAGAASSLAPKPKFTQSYIALLSVPSAIACFYSDDLHSLAPLFVGCWLYAILSARRLFNEYQRAFNIERKLKDNQKKLEQLNQTDSLTGIYNRQYFDDALSVQWDVASRSGTNLSILFLDIDLFKRVNDLHGHLVGDKVLCHVAKLLKDKAKRKSDMIARYGGEEFTVILPNTAHQDAMELAKSIRESLASEDFIEGDARISLTISIGVNSTVPSQQQDRLAFLDQADQALYEAKARGRNCVVSHLETVRDISPLT